MKILFCDVDGVLNSHTTPDSTGWPVDPFMAFLVGRIVMKTECDVVLSSSWRHAEEGRAIVRKRVVPFIDITPDLQGRQCRGAEIKAWLDAHPDVTRYAILDDDSDMLPEQEPNFFKTTFLHGLTEEIAERVIQHLNYDLGPDKPVVSPDAGGSEEASVKPL